MLIHDLVRCLLIGTAVGHAWRERHKNKRFLSLGPLETSRASEGAQINGQAIAAQQEGRCKLRVICNQAHRFGSRESQLEYEGGEVL